MGTPTRSIPATSFHVLFALAGGAKHGLGIADHVEAVSDGRIVMGPGTLYGTIKRLVADGMIKETSWRPEMGDDDSRRRYYTLTSRGERTLRDEIEGLSRLLARAEEYSARLAN